MKSYPKAIIYYFTGTGNSLNVAHWVKNVSVERNMECELIDISKNGNRTLTAPPANALLVFVSPIHGFNYPPVMVNFIAHFPKGKNDVILMNTRAGMLIGKFVTPGLTGIAFYLAALLLKIKGHAIKGMYPVDMPSNWISVHPGLNQRTTLYLHQRMKIRVTNYFNKLLDGKNGLYALREIIQDAAISPISAGYYFAGRFVFAKTFFASADCDNCGLCMKQCPVKAIIEINNRPFWKLTCESCMRCVANCPKKAIETAHGFTAVVALLFNLAIVGGLNLLFPKLILSINPLLYGWVIKTFIFLGLLVISYRIMHYLKRFRWFERIMVFTSLTFYNFWGPRYKAIKGF